jgi:serine/threonine-protein kinase HipA
MSALSIKLGSISVGLLERFDEWDYRFSFDSTWLHQAERPVLGQIFEDMAPRELESTGHLPCWFDHILPPSQSPLRRAITRQAGISEDDDFKLLEVLGEDLPGAVVAVPGQQRMSREPRGASAAPPPLQEGVLRFSLAGQQWKLSVRAQDDRLTVPVRGETGSWIAKFPSATYKDLPRVELATMTWAERAGIEIPPLRRADVSEFTVLPPGIPAGDGSVFLIERFDRRPGGLRVHMEDMAQVLDRPEIYDVPCEHIAAVLAYLNPEDLRPFCERLVFSALCGNTDAHLKNWSLLYPDGRHARLSPAYDLVATVLYVPAIEDKLALGLGGSQRFEDVRVESFRLLAEVAVRSFDEVAGWVRLAAERVRAVWREEATALPYLSEERARIEAHMARVPLGR